MRLRRQVSVLIRLLPALFLPGCGVVQSVATLVPRRPLPPAVWSCPDEPTPPPDAGLMDAALWDWVTDMRAAGQGCRDQLQTAHDIEEGK